MQVWALRDQMRARRRHAAHLWRHAKRRLHGECGGGQRGRQGWRCLLKRFPALFGKRRVETQAQAKIKAPVPTHEPNNAACRYVELCCSHDGREVLGGVLFPKLPTLNSYMVADTMFLHTCVSPFPCCTPFRGRLKSLPSSGQHRASVTLLRTQGRAAAEPLPLPPSLCPPLQGRGGSHMRPQLSSPEGMSGLSLCSGVQSPSPGGTMHPAPARMG